MTNLFHFIPSTRYSPLQDARDCAQCLNSCEGMNLGAPMPNGYCSTYCANVCGNTNSTTWKSSVGVNNASCNSAVNPFCGVKNAAWPDRGNPSGASTAWPRASFNMARPMSYVNALHRQKVHQFGALAPQTPCDSCRFECSLCTMDPCPTPADVQNCVQTKCPSCQ